MKPDPAISDPRDPAYWPEARDRIMDLCPFYDPNHKGGVVREKVFKECLGEMRERVKFLEENLAKCHKALTVCDGAMMGKVKPSSVAFKMIREIMYPESTWIVDESADGKPDGQEENH